MDAFKMYLDQSILGHLSHGGAGGRFGTQLQEGTGFLQTLQFRSVTFILSIAQTTFPLLALLAIRVVINDRLKKAELKKALLYRSNLDSDYATVFAEMYDRNCISCTLCSYYLGSGQSIKTGKTEIGFHQ